jgi:diaminopimelate epimerase
VIVNLLTIYDENYVFVRTYESDIEDETATCGTGSVAAAVALFIKNSFNQEKNPYKYTAYVKYGKMTITFKSNTEYIYDMSLEGPTRLVFDGKIKCICSK